MSAQIHSTSSEDNPNVSIPRLSAALGGRVISPEDAGYDEARTVFAGGIDRHPAVIARVADATDVSRVVDLARESGLELAVRSGATASTPPPTGASCSTSRI
jgi:hypothetical protein